MGEEQVFLQRARLGSALAALLLLSAGCSSAPAERRSVDDLFEAMESEDSRRALGAISALAPLLAAEDLPRVEALLERGHAERALFLLREARVPASAAVLEKHAARLLDPGNARLAKVALGTFAELRVRGASPIIRDYYLSQSANEDAALRALGRIWEQAPGIPPAAEGAERERLRSLLLVHGIAMRAGGAAAGEAMIRIMTSAELGDFLKKNARERFSAAATIAQLCARDDFDPDKGALVHRALLSNPDPDVVAVILWSSPYPLDVWKLLDDDRSAAKMKICCYAAARLEAEETRQQIRFPSPEDRDRLLAKWRAKRPR